MKPWHIGTHLRVLCKGYPMNNNMTGFRSFSKISSSLCFGQKQPQHWEGKQTFIITSLQTWQDFLDPAAVRKGVDQLSIMCCLAWQQAKTYGQITLSPTIFMSIRICFQEVGWKIGYAFGFFCFQVIMKDDSWQFQFFVVIQNDAQQRSVLLMTIIHSSR